MSSNENEPKTDETCVEIKADPVAKRANDKVNAKVEAKEEAEKVDVYKVMKLGSGIASLLSNISRGEIKTGKSLPQATSGSDNRNKRNRWNWTYIDNNSTFKKPRRKKGGLLGTAPRHMYASNTPNNSSDFYGWCNSSSTGQNTQDYCEEEYYDEEEAEEDFTDVNEALAKEFGSFIKMKMVEPGISGYYCEICYSKIGNMRCLYAHLTGAKHLKKKNIWEKWQRMEAKESKNKMESSAAKDAKDQKSSGEWRLGSQSERTSANASRQNQPTMKQRTSADACHHCQTAKQQMTSADAIQQNKPGKRLHDSLLSKIESAGVKDHNDMSLAIKVMSNLIASLKEFSSEKHALEAVSMLNELDGNFKQLDMMKEQLERRNRVLSCVDELIMSARSGPSPLHQSRGWSSTHSPTQDDEWSYQSYQDNTGYHTTGYSTYSNDSEGMPEYYATEGYNGW